MIVAAAILMLLSLGTVVGLVARAKGRPGLPWGIYGLVAAPVALPHVLLLRGEGDERRWSPIRTGLPSANKPCPHCGAAIRGEALACRYCRKPLYAHDEETADPPSRREFEALERALARRGMARAAAPEPRPAYAPAAPERAAAPGPDAGAATAREADREPVRAPEPPPAPTAEPEPAPAPAARRGPEPDPGPLAGPTPVPWPEAPPEPARRHAPAPVTHREREPAPVAEFMSVPWPEFEPEPEPKSAPVPEPQFDTEREPEPEPEPIPEPEPQFETEREPEPPPEPEAVPEPEFAAAPTGEWMPPRDPPRLATSGEAIHWPPIEPFRDEEPGALRRALAPAAFVAALVFAAAVVFAPELFRTREEPSDPARSESVDPAAPERDIAQDDAGRPEAGADAPPGPADGPVEDPARETDVAERPVPAVPAAGPETGAPDATDAPDAARATTDPSTPPPPPPGDSPPDSAAPAATSPAPPSPPAPRATAARISASGQLVAAVQRRLKSEGYDPGPVDGRAGPRTREALAAYQRAQHLVPTGEINEAVLFELGFD